jgi:CheY-like chemotaxis protein
LELASGSVDTPRFQVLAVDDESGIRDFVGRVLSQAYDVCVASDGVEALRLAEGRQPFDLLVTDMMMPHMRGDELARRFRQITPDIKVLYLTGFSEQLFAARPILWENEAFVEKPIGVQGLLEAVALLLVGRVPPPRAPRIRIPGTRIRCGDSIGTLESLSETGARVTVMADMPEGTSWPLMIELPDGTVRVMGRVVDRERCATAAAPNGDSGPYSVAFAFVGTSASARQALQQVIRNTSTSAGASS